MARGFAVLLAGAIAWSPLVADAQSANELAAARRLYQQGVEHAGAGRWPEARAAFERSLEIAERPATLLNLAGALVETGSLVAGSEAYRRYLSLAETSRHRAQAETLLAELDARIPKVVITADGLGDDDVLRLDGEELSHAIVGAELPVDPGTHDIEVVRGGTRVGGSQIEIAEGEHRDVALEIAVAAPETREVDLDLAPDGPSTPVPEDEDEGGGVLTSPWFWIISGALLIGGGVALALVLTSSSSGPAAFTGNVGSGRLGVP